MISDFVLFRLPQKETAELWQFNTDAPPLSTNDLFYFTSFNGSKNFHLKPGKKNIIPLAQVHDLPLCFQWKNDTEFPVVFTKNQYLEKAVQCINDLHDAKFHKVILSRAKKVNHFIDLKQKFIDLCHRYPSAFVYLFHHQKETWMGASPERLLSANKNHYKTVALAGTKSTQEHRTWTNKEHKEHQFVVDYIADSLNDFNPTIHATSTHSLGDIEHLKTDIEFVANHLDLDAVLEKLHPTPAVCGLPKDMAFDYIVKNEGYDRSFYTGYFGIKTPQSTHIYVNLRCAQIFENATAIYVGGGLVKESNALAEWQETELKAQALV